MRKLSSLEGMQRSERKGQEALRKAKELNTIKQLESHLNSLDEELGQDVEKQHYTAEGSADLWKIEKSYLTQAREITKKRLDDKRKKPKKAKKIIKQQNSEKSSAKKGFDSIKFAANLGAAAIVIGWFGGIWFTDFVEKISHQLLAQIVISLVTIIFLYVLMKINGWKGF